MASLSELLSFIRQPPAQAGIPNLQIPAVPGAAQNAAQASADRSAMAQAQRMAGMAPEIYGQAPGPVGSGVPQASGQMMMGQGPLQSMENIPTRTPGTGVYDESKPMQQRLMEMNQRMLQSGEPGFINQWQQNQQAMQGSLLDRMKAMDVAKYKSDTSVSAAGKMAKDAGYAPGTPAYTEFVKTYAMKSLFEKGEDKPLNTSELKEWMTADGKPVPGGTTFRDIKRNGYQLRNVLSAESAGKKTMLDTAREQFPVIENRLFHPDGSVNKESLFGMTAKGAVSGVPVLSTAVNWALSPETKQLSTAFETGIQAITRVETGAQMPAEEITNTRNRFQPMYGDDDETIQQKWRAYKYFINNAIKKIDPIRKDANRTPEQMTAAVNAAADEAFAAVSTPSNSTLKFNATTNRYEDDETENEFQRWKAERTKRGG